MPRKLKPYKKSDYKDYDRVLVWIFREKKHDDYERYYEFKKVYKDQVYQLLRYGGWKVFDRSKHDIWAGESLTGYPLV